MTEPKVDVEPSSGNGDALSSKLMGCACRWDENDERVATCERHQGWLDVVHEWAERAKAAEREIGASPKQFVELTRLRQENAALKMRIQELEAKLPVWQPIEAAPRGECVLVWDAEAKDWSIASFSPIKGEWFNDWGSFNPTHWMPLSGPSSDE